MPEWKNDTELFALVRSTLYTPVVGDILDQVGRFHQFLPPQVRPIAQGMVVAGRAMPVLQMDVFGPQKKPFGLMTQALDDLQENEVYIATGTAMRCANWGEIMTATAKTRRAAGAVVNGYHRDTPKVLEQHWPVFSRGGYAQDSAPRMKVVDFRCPIEVEATWVHPGDIVFGDIDGVVIVPRDIETEVIERALEKARAEKLVRKEIEQGLSSTAAFEKYGIL
ncbi:MAG: RraA family protein [Pirellulales bacterium]|nr:RraA family protein [Pirellulales bacterium]